MTGKRLRELLLKYVKFKIGLPDVAIFAKSGSGCPHDKENQWYYSIENKFTLSTDTNEDVRVVPWTTGMLSKNL